MLLFLFRRDLRHYDNSALSEASKVAKELNTEIIKAFIFTKDQISSNKYKSDRAVAFMMKCLEELGDVHFFFGDEGTVIQSLLDDSKLNITHVFSNEDHSHYAIKRDKQLAKVCKHNNVHCTFVEDYTLHPMNSILTTTGRYYSVYTPFYKKGITMTVDSPKSSPKFTAYTGTISNKYKTSLKSMRDTLSQEYDYTKMLVKGGRKEGTALLSKVETLQKNYEMTRDDTTKPTTYLSAHIKFGTLSIREVYREFKNVSEALVGQLYWNEFYDQLMRNLPIQQTLGNGNFKNKKIEWSIENKRRYLQRWKDGKTGFPFIDAGMRQLNTIGWMHNRARMAVANFLAMTLLIDWKEGERYFAQQLIDYDVSQNNGNWQWSVGLGVDKTGYLRMYNPFSQSKKHDPDCKYIKEFVPELRDVPAKDIHNWDTRHVDYPEIYGAPIVNFTERRQIAIKAYKT